MPKAITHLMAHLFYNELLSIQLSDMAISYSSLIRIFRMGQPLSLTLVRLTVVFSY